jgi:hypothetical protein
MVKWALFKTDNLWTLSRTSFAIFVYFRAVGLCICCMFKSFELSYTSISWIVACLDAFWLMLNMNAIAEPKQNPFRYYITNVLVMWVRYGEIWFAFFFILLLHAENICIYAVIGHTTSNGLDQEIVPKPFSINA